MAVRVPVALMGYACQRTLVCCHAPLRAPCDDDDLQRIRPRLASTAPGRSLLPIVEANFEVVDLRGSPQRVFTHEDQRCVHLRVVDPTAPAQSPGPAARTEPACALHETGGLEALSAACRNYPRSVARVGDDVEVAFLLACPTAARLVVQSREPLAFADVPGLERTYTPTRVAPERIPQRPNDPDSTSTLREHLAARETWWAALAHDRDDPAHLLGLISLLAAAPSQPPPPGTHGRELGCWEGLLNGLTSLEARLFLEGLERMPDRGATYDQHYWPVWREVTSPVSEAALLTMLEVACPPLVAFLEHQILFAGIHDGRAAQPFLRTAARRAVGIARVVDALCHRTPFRLDTLLADTIAASCLVEPLA